MKRGATFVVRCRWPCQPTAINAESSEEAQVRVTNCAQLNKVDPTSKQCLRGHQKTQVRVCSVGVRHVVEFDQKIDVARVLIEVAASR